MRKRHVVLVAIACLVVWVVVGRAVRGTRKSRVLTFLYDGKPAVGVTVEDFGAIGVPGSVQTTNENGEVFFSSNRCREILGIKVADPKNQVAYITEVMLRGSMEIDHRNNRHNSLPLRPTTSLGSSRSSNQARKHSTPQTYPRRPKIAGTPNKVTTQPTDQFGRSQQRVRRLGRSRALQPSTFRRLRQPQAAIRHPLHSGFNFGRRMSVNG